jgi:hypothetical protein
MAIKNYTTDIPAARTIAQIQEMLINGGAEGIYMEMKNRKVDAVNFEIKMGELMLRYRLPCKWESIYKLLEKDTRAQKVMRGEKITFGEEHCRAVGWRIVRDWLDAQLALVEAEMADIKEVMLPYMLAQDGRTAYEVLGGGRLLLGKKE